MKLSPGIIAFVVGVISLVFSWCFHTIWTETEEITVSTPDSLQEAPLTVLTPDVVGEEDITEYTLTGSGEFTLMLGQTRDVQAWLGEATHNVIRGIDDSGEHPTLRADHIEGTEEEPPNPRGSDLWIAEQDVTDSVTQRWVAPETGEWSLLVVGQQGEPAPSDVSVTLINDDVPHDWATPTLWIGIVLLIAGIIWLIWVFNRLAKQAKKKPQGRRVAGRPTDTTSVSTTTLATAAPAAGAAAADAEPQETDPHDAASLSGSTVAIDLDADETEETDTEAEDEPEAEAETSAEQTVDLGAVAAEEPDEAGLDPEDAVADDETDDIDDNADDDDDADTDDDDTDDGETEVTETKDTETADAPEDDTTQDGESGFLKRVIASGASLALLTGLGGVGIAHADQAEEDAPSASPTEATEESPADESPEASEQASEDADTTDEDEDIVPLVVPEQLQQIVERVSGAVSTADEEADPAGSPARIDGQALEMRQMNYRLQQIDEDEDGPEAISSDSIVSAWMDHSSDEFPREVLVVTQGAEQQLPQLLVLTQESPRSQYTLVSNTPLLGGTNLPAHDISDTAAVDQIPGDAEGPAGQATPQNILGGVIDYLSDPEDDAGENIAESAVIEAIHEAQGAESESLSDQNTDVTHFRSLFNDSVRAWTLEDGSMIVTGAASQASRYTPEEGGTVTISETAAELDDSSEDATYEGTVVMRWREQLAVHVSPEGEISLIGYLTALASTDES